MQIRKMVALGTMAAAVAAVPSTAGAVTTYLDFNGNSGTFGNTNPGPDTRFRDSFTFSTPTAGFLTVTWETAYSAILTNLKALVTVNGIALTGTDTVLADGTLQKVRSVINLPVLAGVQTINVGGSAMERSMFSGTLSFTASVVPEPAAWSLMILGVGGIGFAMRRRRNIRTKLSFA